MNPEASPEQVDAAIAWHLYFMDAAEDPSSHAAFQAWLAADVRHQTAWQRLTQLQQGWQTAIGPATVALKQVESLQNDQQVYAKARKYVRQSVAAIACLGLGLGLAWHSQWGSWLMADHRSAVGEVATVNLPDGSLLTLDSGSAVNVRYEHGLRKVTLLKGAVLAQVAKNPAVPFVIETDEGVAQALGTAYTVRKLASGQTEVVVLASQVRVCLAAAYVRKETQGPDCATLVPNQRSVLSRGSLSAPAAVVAADQAAWQHQQLVAKDLPLPALLQALSARHLGVLHYDAASLGQYRVSGVFPLDDVPLALQAIEAAYPVTVRRYTPYLSVISVAVVRD